MISSYISDKVYVKNSNMNGKGMFASENISAGEVVYIKGGYILKKDELFSLSTINSYMPIDDKYYIGARNIHEEQSIKLYNNHSCNPNCGLRGEITFVSIKNIKKGDELTCDYAFIDNEDYSFECNCGSPQCRHYITGFDWKIKSLQEKYLEYFSAYLQKKIRNSSKKQIENNEIDE